jgi:hypothetical protein
VIDYQRAPGRFGAQGWRGEIGEENRREVAVGYALRLIAFDSGDSLCVRRNVLKEIV